MQYFLFGIVALALGLMAMQAFAAASTAAMAQALRMFGGVSAFGIAAVLALRGMMAHAMWVAAIGVWLVGGLSRPWRQSGQAGPTPASSRVVTDHLDVELEHDTGVIRGRVLAGALAGRDLETLSPAELAGLWLDCRFADPASARVLEAYLDRIHPTWRDDLAAHDAAGAHGTGPDGRGTGQAGPMSRDEALAILGLGPGAGAEEIRQAHRDLMLRVHPDRGGSHLLAAKVNEAKDVLLG